MLIGDMFLKGFIPHSKPALALVNLFTGTQPMHLLCINKESHITCGGAPTTIIVCKWEDHKRKQTLD